ncbi:MAG: hypothetical protein V3S39_06850 [Thermodesulfobacteriota bacterium]
MDSEKKPQQPAQQETEQPEIVGELWPGNYKKNQPTGKLYTESFAHISFKGKVEFLEKINVTVSGKIQGLSVGETL